MARPESGGVSGGAWVRLMDQDVEELHHMVLVAPVVQAAQAGQEDPVVREALEEAGTCSELLPNLACSRRSVLQDL